MKITSKPARLKTYWTRYWTDGGVRGVWYHLERHRPWSLSYDSNGCSGPMELNPGISEVVFSLRAEVEALKARLNKIERGQKVGVSAAYWQAVERERDSSEKKKRQLL